MSRTELLKQYNEKEATLKELNQKYNYPETLKYDLRSESGELRGSVEYIPKDDFLKISCGYAIKGDSIKSLRDILNKLIND